MKDYENLWKPSWILLASKSEPVWICMNQNHQNQQLIEDSDLQIANHENQSLVMSAYDCNCWDMLRSSEDPAFEVFRSEEMWRDKPNLRPLAMSMWKTDWKWLKRNLNHHTLFQFVPCQLNKRLQQSATYCNMLQRPRSSKCHTKSDTVAIRCPLTFLTSNRQGAYNGIGISVLFRSQPRKSKQGIPHSSSFIVQIALAMPWYMEHWSWRYWCAWGFFPPGKLNPRSSFNTLHLSDCVWLHYIILYCIGHVMRMNDIEWQNSVAFQK